MKNYYNNINEKVGRIMATLLLFRQKLFQWAKKANNQIHIRSTHSLNEKFEYWNFQIFELNLDDCTGTTTNNNNSFIQCSVAVTIMLYVVVTLDVDIRIVIDASVRLFWMSMLLAMVNIRNNSRLLFIANDLLFVF